MKNPYEVHALKSYAKNIEKGSEIEIKRMPTTTEKSMKKLPLKMMRKMTPDPVWETGVRPSTPGGHGHICIYPHRACRQAHGRVRAVLVMLVVVVQIILQLIQWRGTLLTSLQHSGPGPPRTFDLYFCIIFRDDFLHGF